ncbi:MAG: hypothetical protein ACI3T9_02195 [Romboutsia timonensis]
MIKMVFDEEQEGYVPEECCTFTNPMTTPSGESEIDDVDMPCCMCDRQCDKCVVDKIFNETLRNENDDEFFSAKIHFKCCFKCECNCDECRVQKMFNDYAEKTGQA